MRLGLQEDNIPAAVSLYLNVNASDYPNKFPEAHLSGSTEAISS